MSLFKESTLKSCLLVFFLVVPQTSKPTIPPGAEAIVLTALAMVAVGETAFCYCTAVFATRYRNASDITKNQEAIVHYTVHIKVYDKSSTSKKQFYTIKTDSPEEALQKTNTYIHEHTHGKSNKVRICPLLTLNNGKSFKMKTIESTTTKIDVINRHLTRRLFVAGNKLTYKQKMLLGGIPSLLMGPLGILPLAVYYNV